MSKLDFRQILFVEEMSLSQKARLASARIRAYDYLLQQGVKPLPAYQWIKSDGESPEVNLTENQAAELDRIYDSCLRPST